MLETPLQPEPRNAMTKTQDRARGRQLRTHTHKKPPVLLKIHKQTFSISILDIIGLFETKEHILALLVKCKVLNTI